MPVDADPLQAVQLEEISQPQHVLHKVYVLALLILVATGPEHLTCVDVVEDDPEGLSCRPEGQQDAYLLCIVDVSDDVPELL